MGVTPQTKLADRADRVFFLNGGDNHASCTFKLINAATGRACYTNSVVWTTLPSGGGVARWCCFPSCDRRSAHATEHLFRGRATIAARPCRYCRCLFIATAVASARACRYCRSTGRCPYIAAAPAE